MSASDLSSLLKQGIQAIKAGQKQQARELLLQVTEIDERNEQAWLWLSAAVESPEEQEICLENVLTINPNNQHAQRGLEKVRQKLGKSAPARAVSEPAPPGPPAPAIPPAPPAPALQTPASWQEEPPAPASAGSGSFLSTLGVTTAAPAPVPGSGRTAARTKKKRSLADMLAEDENLPLAREKKKKAGGRGIGALVDAWISALIFDGKGAYEAERQVATIGRTTLGVIISVAAATLLLGIGLYVGLARMLAVWSPSLPLGFGTLVTEGANFAGTLTVLITPFMVLNFFTVAFAMQKAAGLFGSSLDFFDSAHLFSVSYSPTVILLSFLLMVNLLLAAFMLSSINPYTDTWSDEELAALDRYEQLSPIFVGVLGIVFVYCMIVWAHGLGVSHRIGFIGGIIAVIVGLFLSAILSVCVCCGLNYLMGLGNPNVY